MNSTVVSSELLSKKHGCDSLSEKMIDGWKSQLPWLQIAGKRKIRLLKCHICEQKNVISVWAEEGSSNFQVNSIKHHSESKEHQLAEYELSKSSCCLNQVCFSDDEKDSSSVSSSDKTLFHTIFYAANSETPSSQIYNLIQLQKLNRASIEYQNLSWDSIMDIQSCISQVFQKEIIQDIKNCDFFCHNDR